MVVRFKSISKWMTTVRHMRAQLRAQLNSYRRMLLLFWGGRERRSWYGRERLSRQQLLAYLQQLPCAESRLRMAGEQQQPRKAAVNVARWEDL